jgi:hypothetical protein
MTAIVEKIRTPNVATGLALAGRTCLILSGLAMAQLASVFVVFAL